MTQRWRDSIQMGLGLAVGIVVYQLVRAFVLQAPVDIGLVLGVAVGIGLLAVLMGWLLWPVKQRNLARQEQRKAAKDDRRP